MRKKNSEKTLTKKSVSLRKCNSESKTHFKIWLENNSFGKQTLQTLNVIDKTNNPVTQILNPIGKMLEQNQMLDVEEYLRVLENTLKKEIWADKDPFKVSKRARKKAKKELSARRRRSVEKDNRMKKRLRTFSTKLKKVRRNRSNKKLKPEKRYLQLLENRGKKKHLSFKEIFKNEVIAENSSLEDIKKESTMEMSANNLLSNNMITFNLESQLSKLKADKVDSNLFDNRLKPAEIKQVDSNLFENELEPAEIKQVDSNLFDTAQNEYITLRGGGAEG